MSWLGFFNFLVLQWFGVRLARVVDTRMVALEDIAAGEVGRAAMHLEVRWRVLRWVWPLTGWWSDYRWIVRQP